MVKYINNLPTDPAAFPLKDSIDPTIMGADVPTGAAIPHLHGGHTAAQYDGTPDQWWTADGQKGMDFSSDTFTYVNDQPAALLWYHDHTMGGTRFKPYLGLAAAYLLFDGIDNGRSINGQKVPSGYGKYHLPLVLQDKTFNDDGSLYYPTEADGGSGASPDLGARVLRRHPGRERQGVPVSRCAAAQVPPAAAQRVPGPLLQPQLRPAR